NDAAEAMLNKAPDFTHAQGPSAPIEPEHAAEVPDRLIITFRVNHAYGVAKADQLFRDRAREVRLPTLTAAGDEHVDLRGRQAHARVVVLCVADRDRTVVGNAEVTEGLEHTKPFRDARWQDHHFPAVAHDLALSAEPAD